MGVISFGSPVCGMPDSPTVFTKLGYYTDWIEEIMEQVNLIVTLTAYRLFDFVLSHRNLLHCSGNNLTDIYYLIQYLPTFEHFLRYFPLVLNTKQKFSKSFDEDSKIWWKQRIHKIQSIFNFSYQDVPVSKKRTTLKPTFNYEFITQTQPKLTTFKIAPITDKTMTPIPINQMDSLRVIDEKVFKEFLETMFNSKEGKDYRDIIKDDDALTVNKNDKNYRNEVNLDETDSVTEAQYIEGPHTQILDVSDNENGRSSLNAAYTVLDKDNNPYADEFEKKMSKIINNVDLERIIKEEVEYSSHAVNDKKKYVSKINGRNESINEYLSENENYFQMSNEEKAKDKDNEGLNIPDDIFEDLTRAKENETGVLPESVLYQLLSEVIRDEVENININT